MSMAIRVSSNLPLTAAENSRRTPWIFVHQNRHMQVNRRRRSMSVRCNSINKVFEDRSTGIICYRDENGEMICEGYDEGPRLQVSQSCNCNRCFSTSRNANFVTTPNGAIKELNLDRGIYWLDGLLR